MNICEVCGTNFSLARNLARHVKAIHEKIKNYICEYCNKGFTDSYKLKYHLFQHTNIRNFQCEECNRSFKTNSDLNQHRKIHDKNRELRLICPDCPQEVVFTNRSDFNNHYKIHSAENKERALTCPFCGKKLSRGYKLKDHIRSVHENTKDYKCSICSKAFGRRDNLRAHMILHTAERVYQCDWCEFKGKTKAYLVRHKRVCKNRKTSNEVIVKLEEVDRIFVLESRTDMRFEEAEDFEMVEGESKRENQREIERKNERKNEGENERENERKNERENERENQRVCETDKSEGEEFTESIYLTDPIKKPATDCDIKFSEEFNLDFRKGGTDEHHCSMCLKHFSRPYNLVRHIISVHEKFQEKLTEIFCKYCTNFLDRTHFINHLVLKKFICNRCGKLFTFKGHWIRHESKCGVFNKRQPCPICGKIVANEYRLNAHVKMMHNVQLFHCHLCGEHFPTPSDLAAHNPVHWKQEKNLEFICDLCGLRKRSKAQLESHVEEQHLNPIESEESTLHYSSGGFDFEEHRSFPCQRDGCIKSFKSYQELNAHVIDQHATGDFIEEYLYI